MPNFKIKEEKKSNSKKGLGRGLGSLLPTESFYFEDSPVDHKPFSSPEKKTSSVDSFQGSPEQQKAATGLSKPSKKFLSNYKKLSDNNSLYDSGRVLNLAIEKIIPNPTQPRKNFLRESLEELSLSIKEQGVLQPITVRKRGDRFEIIAGERRWRASQMAGLKEVPAILKGDVNNQVSMELALVENLQREDLNILEEAMGYQLLLDDYHLSQKKLALKLGKKRSSIANALRILVLPEDVQSMLRQGTLSLGHAKVLLSISDLKKQSQLAKKTLAKKLSVRALEREIRKEKAKNNKPVEQQKANVGWALELADSLQKILGTKVDIQHGKDKSQMNIIFYSDEALSQFCEKIKNHWSRV